MEWIGARKLQRQTTANTMTSFPCPRTSSIHIPYSDILNYFCIIANLQIHHYKSTNHTTAERKWDTDDLSTIGLALTQSSTQQWQSGGFLFLNWAAHSSLLRFLKGQHQFDVIALTVNDYFTLNVAFMAHSATSTLS